MNRYDFAEETLWALEAIYMVNNHWRGVRHNVNACIMIQKSITTQLLHGERGLSWYYFTSLSAQSWQYRDKRSPKSRPLNSLEHCICTASMTNIWLGRDSNPYLHGSNEPSGPACCMGGGGQTKTSFPHLLSIFIQQYSAVFVINSHYGYIQ